MSKVLIDLYERALKASWPDGAKGEAFDLWNKARILQQEPAADCGLKVVGVLCVSRFRNNPAMENVEFHPAADVEQGQHDLVRKSDADTRMAALKAQRDELAKMLSEVTESYGSCTTYYDEDDEIGDRACCGVLSYETHAADCIVVKANHALDAYKAGQGEKP